MATGERDTAFGIARTELSMIAVGAVLVTGFSWLTNDATGTLRVAAALFSGTVAFAVAVVMVRRLNG